MIPEMSERLSTLREPRSYKDLCIAVTWFQDLFRSNQLTSLQETDILDQLLDSLTLACKRPFPNEHKVQIAQLRDQISDLQRMVIELRESLNKQVGRASFPFVDDAERCALDEVIATCTENDNASGRVELCSKAFDFHTSSNETTQLSLENASRAVLDLLRQQGILRSASLSDYNIRFEFSDIDSYYQGPSVGLAAAIALFSRVTRLRSNSRYAFTGQVSIEGSLRRIGDEAIKCEQAAREGIQKFFAPLDTYVNGAANLTEAALSVLIRKRTLSEVIDEAFAIDGQATGGLERLASLVYQRTASPVPRRSSLHEAIPRVENKYPPGYFRELDSIHVHVDGGLTGSALVHTLVERFDQKGYPSKLSQIIDSAHGPQRESEPELYDGHNPKVLNYFSTSLFGNFADTKTNLRHLLAELARQNEVVIEAERVIGVVDDEIRWSKVTEHTYPFIDSADCGFAKVETTKRVEIHFSCDIPRQGRWQAEPPLSFRTLLDISAEEGIELGGWFLFNRRGTWAYRSNMFLEEAVPWLVKEQRDRVSLRLSEVGRELGFSCEVSALAEQSLAVWKTPLETFDKPKSKLLLADWEEKYPNLTRFWVITPNFLGDMEQAFHRAMLRNLERDVPVSYTYFLRSSADLERLQRLCESLRHDLAGRVNVYAHMGAVVIDSDCSNADAIKDIFESGYFIANPAGKDADGYRLVRSHEPGEILGAELMKPREMNNLVNLLEPLTASQLEVQGRRIQLGPPSRQKLPQAVILRTCLENATAFRADVGEDFWENIAGDYDLIVATEASRHAGQVVRGTDDGYLLLFDRSVDALLCARKLQWEVNNYNARLRDDLLPIPRQAIALDMGTVYRVTRAHGLDLTGRCLVRCLQLLETTPPGEVRMTNSFVEAVRAVLPRKKFDKAVVRVSKLAFLGSQEESQIWMLDLDINAKPILAVPDSVSV